MVWRILSQCINNFQSFFVQNSNSKTLLAKIGKTNVSVSGDTRFDRVATILEKDNTLDFMSIFKNNKLTIVAGSSWPKDQEQLIDFINTNTLDIKFVFAPHNINQTEINKLKSDISKKVLLFSEKSSKNLAEYDVLIVDTIGILTKIYSYADIAYVGGGFGTAGLHNILEPATFGIPIIIGPNFEKFSEAVALVNSGGCISVKIKRTRRKPITLNSK